MENPDMPATRGDLQSAVEQLRSSTNQDLQGAVEQLRTAMKQDAEQLRGEMHHQYQDVVERIADSETRLLNAFYAFGQTNSKRMTELEGNEGALRGRLATLEDRVMELERRINMPPQRTQ